MPLITTLDATGAAFAMGPDLVLATADPVVVPLDATGVTSKLMYFASSVGVKV